MEIKDKSESYPPPQTALGKFLCALFIAYSGFLKRRPYIGGFFTAMVLASLGDFIAQTIEMARAEKWTGFDLHRNACLLIVNGLWNGFAFRSWLYFMEARLPKRDFKSVAVKVICTQFGLNPLVYMPFFTLLHGHLMGLPWDVALSRSWPSQNLYLDTKMWCVYVPSNSVLFGLIPTEYQVLWTSSVSVIWNTILSLCTGGSGSDGIISELLTSVPWGMAN